MFIRLEQYLHSLPANEALRGQGWYRGSLVWAFLRLEGMEAAQGLVYEGKRGVRSLEEQGIIVAAKQTIEGSQLWRSQ